MNKELLEERLARLPAIARELEKIRLGALDQPTDTATAVSDREGRSEEYPLGKGWQTDTLIVCINEEHRKQVFRAFNLKARYILWFAPLLGDGPYRKIIVFRRFDDVTARAGYLAREYMCDELNTKLHKDGEIIVL